MEDAYGEVTLKYNSAAPVVRKHRLIDWRLMAVGFATAFLISAVAFGLTWARWTRSDVVPAYVRSSVNFPIYQPRTLPAGFAVDQTSFKLNSQVVTFVAKRGESEVLFTEQARPRQFDFDNFYTNQLSDSRRTSTNLGSAVIGYFGDGELGSVLTERTWILVRAKQGVSSPQMDTIVQGISN